jgi:hypothetical protein
MLLTFCVVAGISVFEKYSDDFRLNEVHIIPGTHNSGTSTLPDTDKTQRLSNTEQLHIGIRFFDFRVTPSSSGTDFYISHRSVSRNLLSATLQSMIDFLNANPKELLLVYIRRDYDHRTENFSNLGSSIAAIAMQNIPNILLPSPNETSFATLRLKQLRSKLIILHQGDRCFSLEADQCVSWEIGSNLEISDLWRYGEDGISDEIAMNDIDKYFSTPHANKNGLLRSLWLDNSHYPTEFPLITCINYNQRLIDLIAKYPRGSQPLGIIALDDASLENIHFILNGYPHVNKIIRMRINMILIPFLVILFSMIVASLLINM